MHIVAHFITGEFLPDQGGLAQSIRQLAQELSEQRRVHSIVYARSRCESVASDEIHGIRVLCLARQRDVLEAPLVESERPPAEIASERLRLDFLNLRRLIGNSIREEPDSRHIIVSFYVLNHGFVAQRVASALGLPHIAAIRGSDYSRGFQDPSTLPAIMYVVKHADLVVTSNYEQTQACQSIGVVEVKMIYSSVRPAYVDFRWQNRQPDGRIRLFSDAGYSFKKGTNALLQAFATLADEGIPIELEIVGSDGKGEDAFWCRKRDQFRARFGTQVVLQAHVHIDDVYTKLRQCDIYGSATLGEGCSLGRVGALAAGVPLVSTRCGELQDLGGRLARVWLSEPVGDVGFAAALRTACDALLNGDDFGSDEPALVEIRRTLAPSRERREWLAAFAMVGDAHASALARSDRLQLY